MIFFGEVKFQALDCFVFVLIQPDWFFSGGFNGHIMGTLGTSHPRNMDDMG